MIGRKTQLRHVQDSLKLSADKSSSIILEFDFPAKIDSLWIVSGVGQIFKGGSFYQSQVGRKFSGDDAVPLRAVVEKIEV
jgi:hypothetical protein